MFGGFDISEVGFEDMAVGHVPVEDGAQQEEGIHNNGADEPKVEGFSQGVARMCEGECARAKGTRMTSRRTTVRTLARFVSEVQMKTDCAQSIRLSRVSNQYGCTLPFQ